MKRRGFTLIELLVVIAIIAILAAILFPVLSTAKDSAKASACQSNLQQIGKAVMMYADDHSGTLPGLNMFMPAAGTGGAFDDVAGDSTRGSLFKYIGKSRAIMRCPSDSKNKDTRFKDKDWYSYTVNSFCTWGVRNASGVYTGTLDGAMRAKSNTCGGNLSWFGRPTRTIFLVEENTDERNRSGQGQVINDALFHGVDCTADRHKGYASVNFLDGHCGRVQAWLRQSTGKYHDGTYVFLQ